MLTEQIENEKYIPFDMAKKLSDIGFRRNSSHYYYANKNIKNENGKWERGDWKIIETKMGYISEFAGEWGYKKYIPAYTIVEMLEILFEKYVIQCRKEDGIYIVYVPINNASSSFVFSNSSYVVAVSECLLNLKMKLLL